MCRSLLTSLGQLQEEQQQLSMRVRSCIAGALISLSSLPGKFNPVIRPLMDCIKTDCDPHMQVCVNHASVLYTPYRNYLLYIVPTYALFLYMSLRSLCVTFPSLDQECCILCNIVLCHVIFGQRVRLVVPCIL